MLEYFINTHGARKGLLGRTSALRAPPTRLPGPDVCGRPQDVIVRERRIVVTERGIAAELAERAPDGIADPRPAVETRLRGLGTDAVDEAGKFGRRDVASDSLSEIDALLAAGITRSVPQRQCSHRSNRRARPATGVPCRAVYVKPSAQWLRPAHVATRHPVDHAHLPPGGVR